MDAADTPMPGEDPGFVPNDQHTGEPDPASDMAVEGNPQPEPDSSLPPEDEDPEVEDTERPRT